jgi:hypothetical protein
MHREPELPATRKTLAAYFKVSGIPETRQSVRETERSEQKHGEAISSDENRPSVVTAAWAGNDFELFECLEPF